MPYASIHLVGEQQSPETKQRLQSMATDILVDILRAARPLVAVRIVEDRAENWSVAGLPVVQTLLARGAMVTVTIAGASVSDEQMANGIAALSDMLKDVLGPNALPPYVVFELVGDAAWGYKGRSIAAIKAAAKAKQA
jgi:phenylpyruvate tautomerase PptA (4-oxalocrotonate tautomerase family)